ncbi:hypothetical protein [Microcoleus sp. B4-D4]|uniref:hypothetical protein n=1 Tax=Microcoleus sp. B4-D4 TaxID=2818667 RepID=UPI002FD24004
MSRLRVGAANVGVIAEIEVIRLRVKLTSDRPLSDNRYRRSFIAGWGINLDISEKYS